MTPILLALLLQSAGSAGDAQCAALLKDDPAKTVERIGEWRLRGGGLAARRCLGLAYAVQERWAPAATAFEQAALEAETAKDPRRADLWVQSGNAWLAANDGTRARKAFDSALATTLLVPELRGEVHIDRARAAVALGDLAAARADIDKGLALVPSDPFAWYLSAALAQREGKLSLAQAQIAKAVELAPDDADVLLLAGNITGLGGDVDGARAFYQRATKAAPGSPAGKAAEAALAANAPAAGAAAKEPS